MKISPIMRKITLGATILAATACKEARGPLQKTTEATEGLKQIINYMSHENKQILKDTTYKLFARDTVRVPFSAQSDLEDFRQNIRFSMKKKMPTVITGTHEERKVYWSSVSSDEVCDRTDKFINPKAVVKNELFQNKGGDIFVPVEFYGKKNPDPVLKNFE